MGVSDTLCSESGVPRSRCVFNDAGNLFDLRIILDESDHIALESLRTTIYKHTCATIESGAVTADMVYNALRRVIHFRAALCNKSQHTSCRLVA